MDIEAKKDFARLNAGRRVKFTDGDGVIRDGRIVAYRNQDGFVVVGELDDEASPVFARVLNRPFNGLVIAPERTSPIDGLGPLKFPAPQPTAERRCPIKYQSSTGPQCIHVEGHAGAHDYCEWRKPITAVTPPPAATARQISVTAEAPIADQIAALRELLADTPTPWTARLTGPRGYVEINLSALLSGYVPRADLVRFAEYLNNEKPLPGADAKRERELVACLRLVKAILWPAKERK